jgi:uncharacterized protein
VSAAQHPHNSAEPATEVVGRRQRVIALAFRCYKALISPLVHAVSPSRCLYLPTCSEYAYTALVRFGFVRGSWLALRRLMRCHPWGNGGFDPVPQIASSLESVAPNPAATGANHLP